MFTCGNCGQPIGGPVRFCPNCAAPMMAIPYVSPSPTPRQHGAGYYLGMTVLGIVLVVAVLAAVGSLINTATEMGQTPAERASKAEQAARINFAGTGARQLREMMRNPDSFKIEKLLIMNDGASCYHYRAQNGFGGLNAAEAVLSPEGRLETSDAPGFRVLWNKECGGKTGMDATDYFR
jgi:hypothetical protein